ncbi:MAG: S1C family serine protease [Acidimicrobiales bacterium]
MDEDDQGGSGRDPEDGRWDESDGESLRGWIHPDDRLWRHPSEAGRDPARAGPVPTASQPAGQGRSTAPWVFGGATACVVVALVTAGLVMAATGADQSPKSRTVYLVGTPTTDPGLGQTAGHATLEAMVASVRPSTVVLRIHRGGRVSSTTGLVAESGGIIVTPSQGLTGARSITAIEPDGTREQAALVGTDPTSGLAVLRIDDDLPAATFDDDDLPVGAVAVAATLEPRSKARSTPSSLVYAGTVVSTGQASGTGTETTSFSATMVRAPLVRDDLGCPLVAADGHVIGMLELTEGKGNSAMAVFLPSELVLGVALQLVESGTVEHGWVGIQASDAGATATTADRTMVASASTSDGARVDSVEVDSPASMAGLEPGDVITAIDGYPVQSAAELRSRLYPDPPGTDLAVTFERGGTTAEVSVVMAGQDGDAPEDGSSP